MLSLLELYAPVPDETLSPLPPDSHRGITAVTTFALFSLVATAILFAHLLCRVLTWKRRTHGPVNPYVALLLNLVFADLQQALGFAFGIGWLKDDGIFAPDPMCWTQGWFLNAGDVASGLFTLAMAGHLFADIVFDYRMAHCPLVAMIVGIWTLVYVLATIGVILHPQDFYMRAGIWCWISETYMPERLWLHYVWLLLTEFCVVILYTLMFVILWRRIRSFFYVSSENQLRAESAARTAISYPIIYVVCTLPAVVTRLRIMTGRKASTEELTFFGVMLTSSGWLDVLLYMLTRRSLIAGPTIQNQDAHGLDTFQPWTQYRTDDQVDQLTDLSIKRPEMDYHSNDRGDSRGSLDRRGSCLKKDVHVVVQRSCREGEEDEEDDEGQRQQHRDRDRDRERIPRVHVPPHMVRNIRSQGDPQQRPALRFPRRRDPLHGVRDRDARERRTQEQQVQEQARLNFITTANDDDDDDGGSEKELHKDANNETRWRDSVSPEGNEMEISPCASIVSSSGSPTMPKSAGR